MGERRSWQERSPEGRIEVTGRDMEILRALCSYRVLSSGQIQMKFFSSKSFSDRRLRKLFDHGLLDRIVPPVSRGRPEVLYTLGPEGRRIVAEELGVEVGSLRWKRPKNLEHLLSLNNFRLSLEEAAGRTPGYSLLGWEGNLRIEVRPGVRLVPDAFFCLRTPKGKAFFFLEVDRSTEAGRRIERKMELYQAYRKRGGFRRDFGFENFRVLIVTSGPKRIGRLLRIAGGLRLKVLFWMTSSQLISPGSILGNIWIRADRPEELCSL